MFHIPAHKNVTHPAGQVAYREQHPSRQTDEDSRGYPTSPSEPKPRACPVGEGGTDHCTCFALVLQQRIANRS